MTVEPAPEGAAVDGPTWAAEVGLLVVAATLFVVAGPIGLGAGVAIALGWRFVPAPVAVAAGHVLGLVALGGEPGLGPLVAVEVGFLGVLAAPLLSEREWPRTVATVVLLALTLGGFAWLGWRAIHPRWLVGLGIVSLVSVLVYGCHRVAVVDLETAGVERLA